MRSSCFIHVHISWPFYRTLVEVVATFLIISIFVGFSIFKRVFIRNPTAYFTRKCLNINIAFIKTWRLCQFCKRTEVIDKEFIDKELNSMSHLYFWSKYIHPSLVVNVSFFAIVLTLYYLLIKNSHWFQTIFKLSYAYKTMVSTLINAVVAVIAIHIEASHCVCTVYWYTHTLAHFYISLFHLLKVRRQLGIVKYFPLPGICRRISVLRKT